MIRELLYPQPIRSANIIVRAHWSNNAGETRTVRDRLSEILKSKYPAARTALEGKPNHFRVTLVRLAPRAFDGHDNLRASLKPYVDAIAKWVGLADNDRIFSWHYAQERPPRPRWTGLRITIEDLEPLPDVRVELLSLDEEPAPRPAAPVGTVALTVAQLRERRAKAARGRSTQRVLVFRPAWAALPWRQDPAADDYDVVDIGALAAQLDYPATVAVVDPNGRQVTLFRHDHFDDVTRAKVWLYSADRPHVAAAGDEPKEAGGRR